MKKKRYWTIFKVWFYHPIRTFIMGMEMGLLLLLITPDIAGNPDYMEQFLVVSMILGTFVQRNIYESRYQKKGEAWLQRDKKKSEKRRKFAYDIFCGSKSPVNMSRYEPQLYRSLYNWFQNLQPDKNDTNSIRKMRKKQFSEKIMQINSITKITIPMMPTPQDIRHRQREIRQINQDITGKILPGYIYGKFFSEKNKKNFQKYKTFFSVSLVSIVKGEKYLKNIGHFSSVQS